MASLKCSKCGNGIHYHDEPNGTEWIAFETDTWNYLCSSSISISAYETTAKSGWYTIWKCKDCGTLHIFNGLDVNLDKVYELQDFEDLNVSDNGIKCIAFDDIAWDEITETEKNGNDFDNSFKGIERKYIRISRDKIQVYRDENFTLLEKSYTLL